MGYMVCQYEIYRRLAQSTPEPALKQLLGEIILHYWGIFQETGADVLAAMLDFCNLQLREARISNNKTAWSRWSLIKATLINLPQ